MMKYVTPKIKPFRFFENIETTNSAVVNHYMDEAHKNNPTTENTYTRVEHLKDIILFK